MSCRYSVLTFIIGRGYEKVHELLHKQDDVDYVLVTDDPSLASSTWRVVCDQSLSQFKTPFEKCFSIRYDVFKYCKASTCITIDGSMQVKGSLDKLIDAFDEGSYDICLMPHPFWDDMYSEYNAWMRMRGYPVWQAQRAVAWLASRGYDFKQRGLFQLCFSVKRNDEQTRKLDKMAWDCLHELSRDEEFERLDQPVFTYVMNTFFSSMKVLPVSEQIVRSSAIQWYWHNSDKPNMNIGYDMSREDKKFMFNREVTCMYLT